MQALQTATNISFKNILLLTDFSEASQAALAYAIGFARHFKTKLYPAHAADPVVLSDTVDPSVVNGIIENSRKRLDGLIKDKDITVFPLFTRGSVDTIFPRWIDEHGIDLVVLGTHGRRGLERFLLGSTAEFIFRNASCPVLTAGPHVELRPYQGFSAEHILFPTDLGPHADYALMYALSFARESHARLTMIHVLAHAEKLQGNSSEVVLRLQARLEALLPSDAREWCTPEIIVTAGDPAVEVMEYAERERPDLIVLGLPRNKKFDGHFRTGVTSRIVAGAPCPVLTMRDEQNA